MLPGALPQDSQSRGRPVLFRATAHAHGPKGTAIEPVSNYVLGSAVTVLVASRNNKRPLLTRRLMPQLLHHLSRSQAP